MKGTIAAAGELPAVNTIDTGHEGLKGMGVSGVDWRGNRQQSVGDAQAATIHVHIGPWLRFDLRPGLRHADCGYSHGRAAGIGFAR